MLGKTGCSRTDLRTDRVTGLKSQLLVQAQWSHPIHINHTSDKAILTGQEGPASVFYPCD